MVTPNPLLYAADSSCTFIGSDNLQASVMMSHCTNKSGYICQPLGNPIPLCLHTYELSLGQIPINQASHHLLVHGQHHAGVSEREWSWATACTRI